MRRNGNLDVAGLGQVFTPPEIVTRMLALRENAGRVLEPSCGDGAFFKRIPACVGIEFDASVAPDGCVVMDFFDYPRSERFETVIGNPPYVRRRDVAASTAEKLPKGYDGRTNLSVFFMDKCLDHLLPGGELILIVPREFMKATSARPLNERLHAEGTFSHLVDLGDGRIFKGAAPNCVILRWVKGDSSHVRRDGAVQSLSDGLLVFRPPAAAPFSGPLLSEIFDVKVGAVSGDDGVFADPARGFFEIVGSKTMDTGLPRKVVPHASAPHEVLLPFKERLLSRRIRRFKGDDWWEWGRPVVFPDGPRLYVNAKTRRKAPFFQNPCTAWDGSVLALFPKKPGLSEPDLAALADALNAVDWVSLGFDCAGRLQFGQRSLSSAQLPPAFDAWRP